jgi:hypothetical protein
LEQFLNFRALGIDQTKAFGDVGVDQSSDIRLLSMNGANGSQDCHRRE